MKLAIATRADASIKIMTEETWPSIKRYAGKVSADFIVLDHKTDYSSDGKYHYRILKIGDRLEDYDRVLSLDSDVLIAPSTPNIFDEVPSDKIGTIFEDVGSRKDHRRNLIKEVQSAWGPVGWSSGYINTGVFLVSRAHKTIFDERSRVWEGFGFDDVHLGYFIRKFSLGIHELPFKWNHMTMFEEDWNNRASRFLSYIIHYAGRGVFDLKNCGGRIEQIRRDRVILGV